LPFSPDRSWRQTLAGTVAATVPGVLLRLGAVSVPYPVQLLAYGAAVVAASFLLAWASEAAQAESAHGAVVAAVAFVGVLPEYVVETHFALSGQGEYVTANLTGASRLLLGCAVALPAAVSLLPAGRRPAVGRLELPAEHRVALAVLGLSALWSLRGVLTGRLTGLDGVVLIGGYAFYLRRAGTAGGEAPAPLGVAAALARLPAEERRRWVVRLMAYAAGVIAVTAVPFGDAVLGAGRMVGASPYLLLQWLVPLATETPELVVAIVLLAHGRGGQSIAVLLAGAVSQYTLALGTLPLAWAAGKAHGALPLAGRERVELFLTIGVALYAVTALLRLRLSRGDSAIMLGLFTAQLLVPSVLVRLLLGLTFWAVAIDVVIAERPPLRALLVRAPSAGPARSRPSRARAPSPAADAAARRRRR
jgi:cation:H+ antiporter